MLGESYNRYGSLSDSSSNRLLSAKGSPVTPDADCRASQKFLGAYQGSVSTTLLEIICKLVAFRQTSV